MREVVAFLVWLLSFWTWKDLFLRWLGRPSSLPPNGEAAEHLASQEGQQVSALARFLSSLPADERRCSSLYFSEDSEVQILLGRSDFTLVHGTGAQEGNYREFLGAVASSKIVFCEEVKIELWNVNCCKHVEAFGDALRLSGNRFRKFDFHWGNGPSVPFAKCASSVLLGNDAIEELRLAITNLIGEMGKEEVAEFLSIVDVPHNLQILKSFWMGVHKLDKEGMELLLKSLQGPSSVLEELWLVDITSDDKLKSVSGLLASSMSLKKLGVYSIEGKEKTFTRGYKSIATALCSNQSLESLECEISSSTELKVLLDPLMPKNNNLQSNNTLTKFTSRRLIGGKEGVETLANMLCTNMSLLELDLYCLDAFSSHGEEGIENVLAILKALKTNKSLKKIGFRWCAAVGGYKMLGAMMDLLLENHCIEDINLDGTGLQKTGDADYVYSTLSKRKKVRLWSIVQGMANVNPSSGRVFLCGNPYAGKTRLCMSMKQSKEFQGKDEVQNRPKI